MDMTQTIHRVQDQYLTGKLSVDEYKVRMQRLYVVARTLEDIEGVMAISKAQQEVRMRDKQEQ